jgi:hypothetical protein
MRAAQGVRVAGRCGVLVWQPPGVGYRTATEMIRDRLRAGRLTWSPSVNRLFAVGAVTTLEICNVVRDGHVEDHRPGKGEVTYRMNGIGIDERPLRVWLQIQGRIVVVTDVASGGEVRRCR